MKRMPRTGKGRLSVASEPAELLDRLATARLVDIRRDEHPGDVARARVA
jgi:hypothetical protein